MFFKPNPDLRVTADILFKHPFIVDFGEVRKKKLILLSLHFQVSQNQINFDSTPVVLTKLNFKSEANSEHRKLLNANVS